MSVSASDWVKGITLSVMASMIGGASKLAIRKSWILEEELDRRERRDSDDDAAADGLQRTDVVGISHRDGDDHDDGFRRAGGGRHHQPIRQTEEEGNNRMEQPEYGSRLPTSTTSTASNPLRRWKIKLLRLSGVIGMTTLNPLCSLLAMNYASPSILAPFAGLTLVWIVLFSKQFVGEQPTTLQIVAASLIILGEVVVAVFGDHTNDENVTLAQLEASYRDPSFQLFCVCMIVWMLLVAYWMRYSTSPLLKRFAWGVSGGSITGFQNFLKDFLTTLKARGDAFPWYLPVLFLSAITTALIGLLFLVATMKRYDATYSSSMFVGSFVVSASIMSVVHYNTFQNLETIWNYIMYPTGLLILMSGVYILVIATKESLPESAESENGQEISVQPLVSCPDHDGDDDGIETDEPRTLQ